MFAIFFGYPIVGLVLIFGKMAFSMETAPSFDDIKADLDSVLDIELEA